jgi:hypothetical protein
MKTYSMSDSGFGPGDVVNRRVNDHMRQLLPSRVSPREDYHLEGQRFLPPDAIPGSGDECLCLLESYAGKDGQFKIHVERVFDGQTDREWRIENTISRTNAVSLSPFTYVVNSRIEILDDVERDRSRVTWAELADDRIYGGREAQAAVFLTEKMSQLRARENRNGGNHAGSLSRLGSLASIIDTSRQLQTDWKELDELLGPTADTIAATVGFEPLEERKRVEAEKKGIDFLTDDLADELDRGRPDTREERSDRSRPPWKTSPAELTAEETEQKVKKLNASIRRMRRDHEPRD